MCAVVEAAIGVGFDKIVLRRSDEYRIDQQTNARASMLNLYFDLCDDARQSVRGNDETVGTQ